jgi:GNAT superfamily N-acetyltransferase
MCLVHEVGPDDWAILRDIRLAALQDAPQAFESTYQREARFTEAQWRGRIKDRAVTFFAHLDEDPAPAGIAGVFVDDGAAELVSMWVLPAARGRGVGAALVTATAGWAKARDTTRCSCGSPSSTRRPGGCMSAAGSRRAGPAAAAFRPHADRDPDAPAALARRTV